MIKRALAIESAIRAESISELILERAGPVISKIFFSGIIAFRLIPVIVLQEEQKPENDWKR